MSLTLARKPGRSIIMYIGCERIAVTVTRIADQTVRLKIDAPPACRIVRDEKDFVELAQERKQLLEAARSAAGVIVWQLK